MILTLISPAGERWTIDPAPPTGTEWADWLEKLGVPPIAAKPLVLIRDGKTIPPSGKSLVAHTKEGWHAILSNP